MNVEMIKNLIGEENVLLNEPMKKHTTFRCGGNAEIYAKPQSVESLIELIHYLKDNATEYFILGRGSNLLVKDGGISGVTINTNAINAITIEGNDMNIETGATLALAAIKARDNSLTGMEAFCAIPGSFGGAVFMNAGAHGVELKDVLTSVDVLNEDGEVLTLKPEDLDLSYRHSNVEEKGYIVLSGKMSLMVGNKEEISAEMEDHKNFRKSQPSEPSAGSTFKRGEGFITAKLIDDAGLKGYTIGDACVSEKHAGFVVNKGEAHSKDVLEVIDYVKKEVYNKYKVEIKEEVRIVGKDN